MTAQNVKEPHPRVVQLASQALYRAIDEDWPAANKAVQTLADEFGGDGVMSGVVGWINTMIHHTPGLDGGGPVHLAWMEMSTGRIDEDAEQVPDGVRWAGRLCAAKVADDRDTFEALVNAVPDDATFSRYIGDLLAMVALNVRTTLKSAEGGSR